MSSRSKTTVNDNSNTQIIHDDSETESSGQSSDDYDDDDDDENQNENINHNGTYSNLADDTSDLFDSPLNKPTLINNDDINNMNNNKMNDGTSFHSLSSTTAQHLDETNTLLAELGILQDSTKAIVLASQVERELFRLFDTNEPYSRTQIIDHAILKNAHPPLKKKQIEDGLEVLLSNGIVIQSSIAGGKNSIFYLNQALRPKVTTDQLEQLHQRVQKLDTTLQFNKIALLKLESDTTTMKKSTRTDELEDEVKSLRETLQQRQSRLQLLQSVSSDPQYIQTLKQTYTNAIYEWKKRKNVMNNMSELYLSTVQKKQKVFFRELGCEGEEADLGISLNEYIDYGKKQNIFDTSGRVLQPGSLNSQQSLLQSQSTSNDTTSTHGNPYQVVKLAPIQVRAGETFAQKLIESLNKPPSPPKVSGTGRNAQQINQPRQLQSFTIPPLVHKTLAPQSDVKQKKK